jgi:predicted O-methyltransferase YrrM
MRSSYRSACELGEVLKAIVTSRPVCKRIAEFGILDGFSLDIFERYSPANCRIDAFDIFDEFNGNSATPEKLTELGSREKITIAYGDFYNSALDDGQYDLIHIDIANDGATFMKALDLVPKLTPDGVLVLEGGTAARDGVAWMASYDKTPICEALEKIRARDDLKVHVFGTYPGITTIRRVAP